MSKFRVIVKREKGLHRGGHFFEGDKVYDAGRFNAEQLKQIRAEPLFHVEDVADKPEPEPKGKK